MAYREQGGEGTRGRGGLHIGNKGGGTGGGCI